MLRPRLPAPPTTPARAALAERVAKHKDAQAEFARVTAAHARADAAALTAFGRIAEAEEVLRGAGQVDVDALMAAEIGGDAPPVRQISERAAREALTAAEDELAEARRLREALGLRVDEARGSLSLREHVMRNAAKAVMAQEIGAEIEKWLNETLDLFRELCARKVEFAWLKHEGLTAAFPEAAQALGYWMPSIRGGELSVLTVEQQFRVTLRDPKLSRRMEALIDALCADPAAPAAL